MSNLNWKISKWQEEFKKRGKRPVNKENVCDICGNKGFIIDKRIVEDNEFEYSLHCVCSHGNKWESVMFSFEKYYTIEQLLKRMVA